MRKIIFTGLAVMMAVGLAFSQVSFGVQGGLNLATVAQSYEDSDSEWATKFRAAPRVGVVADIQLADFFALRPGLFYSGKGFAVDVEEEFDAGSDDYLRFTYNYLEVPVSAVFKFNNLELFAGPYLAIAVGGKIKAQSDGEEDDEDIEFQNEIDVENDDLDNYYRRSIDFGINAGIGYRFGPVLASVSLIQGLNNTIPKYTGGGTTIEFDDIELNTAINFSATFFFN